MFLGKQKFPAQHTKLRRISHLVLRTFERCGNWEMLWLNVNRRIIREICFLTVLQVWNIALRVYFQSTHHLIENNCPRRFCVDRRRCCFLVFVVFGRCVRIKRNKTSERKPIWSRFSDNREQGNKCRAYPKNFEIQWTEAKYKEQKLLFFSSFWQSLNE